ncbi:hypothetical protein AAFC00_002093 [Neodothiora populina]|uniref:Arginyl-tRNA--protein transferase 1 n=1 Tax=Neodothiora populina TaxID=2781224 RepID=A0ABR3PG87_9PEZI
MEADSISLLSPIGACYYATCRLLSVDTYQTLVDRGWRRSGSLVYKPDVFRACCPHYTIRLPVASLVTTRDQRQALNRWNKYVLGESYIQEVSQRFPKTKEEKARQKHAFDFLHVVHEAEKQSLKPVEPVHRFEVSLDEDTFTEEKFLLYKDYQINVHHDKPSEISQSGFKRFLCSSPLNRCTRKKNGKDVKLGSYHQCYRLDGRLIAIGVLDLLPHAVSGVYFIYHQDFEKWSFGKLSAMREAALALEGGYEFYYMGYYIHSCVKMKYKGEYKPQYVLDPESYEWNLLDDRLRGLLDKQKYVSLSVEEGKKSTRTSSEDLGEVTGYQLPSPKEAADAGLSLLSLGMPGIPDATTLEKEIILGEMKVAIGSGRSMIVQFEDLQTWDDGDVLDGTSLKGIVAEFAACIGPEAAKGVIVDFTR